MKLSGETWLGFCNLWISEKKGHLIRIKIWFYRRHIVPTVPENIFSERFIKMFQFEKHYDEQPNEKSLKLKTETNAMNLFR